jgi:ABC-type lipoprotein release transport system permease subunit
MKISQTLSIVTKKLKKNSKQALFLIIPISLLLATAIVLASQVQNFSKAMDKAIFETIATQSTVLQITKVNQQQGGGFAGDTGGGRQDRSFNSNDISTVKNITNVTSATVNYTLPINKITSLNLVQEKIIDFGQMTVASPEIGSLYIKGNSEKFDFDITKGDNQVVPIIVNANSMQEVYEDWGGKTVITTAPNSNGQRQNFRDVSPIKGKAIDIGQEQLLGKEFTISFGGLDNIPTYTSSFEPTGAVFTKSTDSEILTKTNDRQTAISKYWDYENIKAPLEVKFKIIGYIKSDTNRSTYIPEAFAEKLMKKIIAKQLDARKAIPVPVAELGVNYRGITYNGDTLQTAQGQQRRVELGSGARTGATSNTANLAYTIPGLVIKTDPNTNEIIGSLEDEGIFSKAAKTSQNLAVKFNSIYNREQVVKDLNSKGFSYLDTGNYKVFNDLQKTLKGISSWLIGCFIALVSIILAFNMSKTISEAKKEVGIFRAVGFTKSDIVSIFTTQGLLYTMIGAILGVILGIILNIIISPLVFSKFNDLVSKTITETYSLTPEVNTSQFINIDWQNLGIICGILFALSILISLVFSLKASAISPVEAIKE